VTPAGVAVRTCRTAAPRPSAPGTTMGGPEAHARPAAAPAERARAAALAAGRALTLEQAVADALEDAADSP
jgi:hypothetical protein